MKKKLKAIDLFAGCGGLSEGFLQSDKYEFLAHVEWELPMVNTLRENLEKRWGHSNQDTINRVIHFDIQKTDELINGNWSENTKMLYEKTNGNPVKEGGLKKLIGKDQVDVIIGGPPCQAYSIAGRAQDPDSMQNDYRNYLFESFVKVVDKFKPKVFVFENVPGILSAKPGGTSVLERIYQAFHEIGYEIRESGNMKNSVYTSADYKVPQERKRVIILGVLKDSELDLENFYNVLDSLKSSEKKLTVRDAIYNFPKFFPLDSIVRIGNKNISHGFTDENNLDLHIPRYHNKRDMDIFEEWINNNMNKLSTKEKLEYYYSKTGKKSNHSKYRNLEWDKPSPTIVSHLYKDGLMFIHPDSEQKRSITIREAASLQTFPNDYIFVGSSAYCFKMIGNAVPVNFSKFIGLAVWQFIKE
ncbi:DNA cytosine methyltransferase [Macrococcus capreoli]|uniref:DNA cytosine methyltransferase n=1 Tax=Macrococcus capreoli TaxID=2982690 RepID=UPI0021D6126F|nr:DNA cytosine methyltransferase [Macrococcus sp. TMW 2.2395]MCU7558185.1 DNA cytosine methyltransferase [Macrococcus sp. TMW 2.2395]